MKQPPEVLRDWIDQINERGRGLTKWEEDFMDSITEQFAERGSLSPKQTEILERIYADRT